MQVSTPRTGPGSQAPSALNSCRSPTWKHQLAHNALSCAAGSLHRVVGTCASPVDLLHLDMVTPWYSLV